MNPSFKLDIPKAKRKIRKTINRTPKGKSNTPQQESKLANAIIRGEQNINHLVSAYAKDKRIPEHLRKQRIHEMNVTIDNAISECRELIVTKSLQILKSLDPEKLHNNSKALAFGILIDKATKLNEATKLLNEAEETPQQKLLSFVRLNDISFSQLQEIIRTNQLPPDLSPDVFRQLRAILHQLPAHTIDVPTPIPKPT